MRVQSSFIQGECLHIFSFKDRFVSSQGPKLNRISACKMCSDQVTPDLPMKTHIHLLCTIPDCWHTTSQWEEEWKELRKAELVRFYRVIQCEKSCENSYENT